MRIIHTIIFITLFTISSFAQYENLLKVQDAKEVSVLKSNRIKSVTKYQNVQNTYKVIYTAKYNSDGRIIAKEQGLTHKSFGYDNKGKLILLNDTTDIPDEKTWITYDFKHENTKGLLSFFRGFAPSGFEYFADKNMLQESQLSENGAYFMRYYYYDNAMRLTKAYHTTPYKDTEKVEIITYHKNTNLRSKDVEVHFKKRLGIDTSVTINTYDGENNLLRTKNISYNYKYNFNDTTFKTFIKEIDSNSYSFVYDTLNRKIKENYHTPDPAYNYTYSFVYNKDNLLIQELYTDKNKIKPVVNYYEYEDVDGKIINPINKVINPVISPKPKQTKTPPKKIIKKPAINK